MSVVCVAKYTSVEEAIVARSKLEFYGIPAWFAEEHAARLSWIYLQAASFCHLEVPVSCEDDALFLLEETEVEPLGEADQYDRQQRSKYKIVLILTLVGAVGEFALLPILDHVWHWLKKKRRP